MATAKTVWDANGKITYLQSSGYDAKRETLVFSTNHFSVYGVGYKNPMAFTDISNPETGGPKISGYTVVKGDS